VVSIYPFVALRRYGFGPTPGQAQTIGDPQSWLYEQLNLRAERAHGLSDTALKLENSRERLDRLMAARRKSGKAKMAAIDEMKKTLFREAAARMMRASHSDAPFYERLVWFWSNHFTVSISAGGLMGLAGVYEREAIRPNILGKFEDLLLAAVKHPAMLVYLDQAQSIGPNSQAGKVNQKGINENLAREILELHTVSVHGGYTLQDIQALAKMLTGWGLANERYSRYADHAHSTRQGFAYYPVNHEPGVKTLLGRDYSALDGYEEAEQALRDLARRRDTARFVCTKLARHFAGDRPPGALVKALITSYLETGGALKPLYHILIESDEVWDKPMVKYLQPLELIVSTFRALSDYDDWPRGRDILVRLGRKEAYGMITSADLLGQFPFDAKSPQGWADIAEAWRAPEATVVRAEWAYEAGMRTARRLKGNPVDLAEDLLGPFLDGPTRQFMERAESRGEAIALMLASPAFQHR